MKYIIEGPLRFKRVVKQDALRHLDCFSEHELNQPLSHYTELIRQEEEWLLKGERDEAGYYTKDSTVAACCKVLRDIAPQLSLAQVKEMVEKMLEEQQADGRQYIFRRCL